MAKEINKRLPLKKCWDMANAIQNGNTPHEIRRRCVTAAEQWLTANEVTSNDGFDGPMSTVAYLYRE